MLHLNGDNYMIQGESSGFENRQKSIFDQLDAVAVKQNKVIDDSEERKGIKFMRTDTGNLCTDDLGEFSDDVLHKDKKYNTKHFKGKESIFKRPEPPPPRFKRTIPDFQRNPHKWVKYSLSDVSQDDMSDKTNTAVAMAFLNEMKTRKDSCKTEEMEIDTKITFKKPFRPKNESHVIQLSKEDSPGEDGTSYFRGSKLIMPEYVVGEKKKMKKQSKSDSDDKKKNVKEIKLNHLTDFDDDDDECIDDYGE